MSERLTLGTTSKYLLPYVCSSRKKLILERMTELLICLVCCPLLLCYDSDKDIIHVCKSCKRQLTVKRFGSNEVTVVASARQEQSKVPSAYQ